MSIDQKGTEEVTDPMDDGGTNRMAIARSMSSREIPRRSSVLTLEPAASDVDIGSDSIERVNRHGRCGRVGRQTHRSYPNVLRLVEEKKKSDIPNHHHPQSSEWKRPDERREISLESLKLSIHEVIEEGRRTDTPCHRPQISLISGLQLSQRGEIHRDIAPVNLLSSSATPFGAKIRANAL